MPEGRWLSHLRIQEDSPISSDQRDFSAPPQSLLRSHRKQSDFTLASCSLLTLFNAAIFLGAESVPLVLPGAISTCDFVQEKNRELPSST